MFTYSVFGGTLRTDLPFPALSPGGSLPPRWVIRTCPAPLVDCPGDHLAEDMVDGSTRVRLSEGKERFFLTYDDTGVFAVSRDGTEIAWSPGYDPKPESVRLDILGRVLPLALHLQRTLCLHASSVALNGMAIGFLAPPYHGKSTLAQALVSRGAELVTDDVLPIEFIGDSVRVFPGVQHVRLWADSARFLGAEGPETDWKVYLQPSPGRLATGSLPLAALYRLNPVRAGENMQPIARTSLQGVYGTLELLRNMKLGQLLTRHAEAEVLEQAATVAQQVPIYRLDIVRELDRMPEVVEQLHEWHAGEGIEPPAPAAAQAKGYL